MRSKTLLSFASLAIFISVTLFLNSCNTEEPDPCEGVSCLNGGTCVNGQCDCADGYSGPDCSDQITPIKMRISKIKITRFPQYDDGSNWDTWDGPDIYVVVNKGEAIVHEQPSMFEDADATQNYTYNPIGDIDIDDPTAQHSISLYDYDDGFDYIDDYMGGIYFYPYMDGNGFPEIIDIDAGGNVAFELTVEYVW